MPDNVAVTAGSGTTISTEEVTTLNGGSVSAQHVQRVVPALRTADGTAIDVTTAAPMPVSGTVAVSNFPAAQPVTDNGGSLTVDGTVAATQSGTWNIGAITTIPTLPAGTNNIGDVDVLTLPAITGTVTANLAAGANNIGDVDVLTLPTLPAGTNAIGKLAANSGVDIGDVDVTSVPVDPFGANADAVVAAGAAGSIQAKLRRLTTDIDAIKTSVAAATPAGTNNIGDVDVLTLPATPAGTNLIGKVSSGLDTGTMYDGTTVLVPKFAVIDTASSGDTTIVAAVTSKKVRVLSAFLISAGTVNVRFESGTGGTALTGQMNLVANAGFVLPFNPAGWFETASNTLLNLELSAATSVDGSLTYVEV